MITRGLCPHRIIAPIMQNVLFVAVTLTATCSFWVVSQSTTPVAEPTYLLQKGRTGTLTCKVPAGKEIHFLAWNKGPDEFSAENIVRMTIFDGEIIEKGGPGYDNGQFDISDDYSLIIHEVKIQDQGRYYCEAVDGYVSRSHTNVSVFAPPIEPYPVVDMCVRTESDDTDASHCTIDAPSSRMNITCSVYGYFPQVSLEFRQGGRLITPVTQREWKNDDDTLSKSVTVTISSHDGLYECSVSNIPGYPDNLENSVLVVVTSVITLTTEFDENKRLQSNKTNRLIISISVACTFLLVCVLGLLLLSISLWKRIRSARNPKPDQISTVPEKDVHLIDLDGAV